MSPQHSTLICVLPLGSSFVVLQEDTLHLSYDWWALNLISYAQSPNRSDALIQWAAEHFLQPCFLVYEQVHPEDPFGHVMQQHFSQLNTALHSLAQYPDCEAQQRRFLGKVSTFSSMKHDLSEEDWNTKCLVSYGLKQTGLRLRYGLLWRHDSPSEGASNWLAACCLVQD